MIAWRSSGHIAQIRIASTWRGNATKTAAKPSETNKSNQVQALNMHSWICRAEPGPMNRLRSTPSVPVQHFRLIHLPDPRTSFVLPWLPQSHSLAFAPHPEGTHSQQPRSARRLSMPLFSFFHVFLPAAQLLSYSTSS